MFKFIVLFVAFSKYIALSGTGRIGRKEGDQAVDDAYVNPRREASTARAASFVQGGKTSQAEEVSRSTLSWK